MKKYVLKGAMLAIALCSGRGMQALNVDDVKRIVGLLNQVFKVMLDADSGIIRDIEKLSLSTAKLRAFTQCVPKAAQSGTPLADLVIDLKSGDKVVGQVHCNDYSIAIAAIQALLSTLNTKVLGDKDHPGLLEAVLEILQILGVDQVKPVNEFAATINGSLKDVDDVLTQLKTKLTVKPAA